MRHIPNGVAAPNGVDKWKHNNALVLNILDGTESVAEQRQKVIAYMQRNGFEQFDDAMFRQQLTKDAVIRQQILAARGLYHGAIDGKLGDFSRQAQDTALAKFGGTIPPTLVRVVPAPEHPAYRSYAAERTAPPEQGPAQSAPPGQLARNQPVPSARPNAVPMVMPKP